MPRNKIIAIVGTTASGKTKLGVSLAYKFNGEIVSADSRQVYRGMDIGTGKDLGEYKLATENCRSRIANIEIPHHCIDIADPNYEFCVADFQKHAFEAIEDILSRGKLPIIVGGTGLYVQAVVDGYALNPSKPDQKKRQILDKFDINELFEKLKSINPKLAQRLNQSDKRNKHRLIRLIEVIGQGGEKIDKKNKIYDSLVIAISRPKDELIKLIHGRLINRLENEDMIGEVERLNKNGVSWKRLESFGLEYKFIAQYLQEKIDYDAMVERIEIASRQYAKRQITWLKRWEKQGREINWVNDMDDAEKKMKQFLE
jgi:tRNA dimethylallyltransferase